MFSANNNPVEHMNSERKRQHVEDLCKLKADKIPAWITWHEHGIPPPVEDLLAFDSSSERTVSFI